MHDRMLISLGGRCEVRWQIDKLMGEGPAFPFDWLVTPLDSIPMMIWEKFAHIADGQFLERSYYIHPFNGKRLETMINRRYNVFLHHEFSRDENGLIADHWRDEIPTVQQKWKFVVERWFDLISSTQNIVFVRRRGNFSMPEEQSYETHLDDLDNVVSILRRISPSATLAVADAGCEIDHPYVTTGNIGMPSPDDWESQDDYWKGATSKWQPFLNSLLA